MTDPRTLIEQARTMRLAKWELGLADRLVRDLADALEVALDRLEACEQRAELHRSNAQEALERADELQRRAERIQQKFEREISRRAEFVEQPCTPSKQKTTMREVAGLKNLRQAFRASREGRSGARKRGGSPARGASGVTQGPHALIEQARTRLLRREQLVDPLADALEAALGRLDTLEAETTRLWEALYWISEYATRRGPDYLEEESATEQDTR